MATKPAPKEDSRRELERDCTGKADSQELPQVNSQAGSEGRSEDPAEVGEQRRGHR